MESWSNSGHRNEANLYGPAPERVRERGYEFAVDEPPELNLTQAILSHKLLLLFFAVIGGGLGYLNYAESPTIYASSARLRLIRTAPVLGVDGLHEMFAARDPLDTHLVLMKSPIIIDRAVEKGNLTQLPMLGKNAAAVITSGLRVVRSEDSTEIVDLSFQGGDPDACRQVLNSVLVAYIDYLGESQGTSALKTLELITEAKDEILQNLSRKEDAYAQFRNSTSLLWSGEEGKNIHAERLAGIESQRAQMMLEQTMLESQLKSIQTLLDRGENREAIIFMIDQLDRNDSDQPITGSTASLAQQLMPLVLEEQLLLDRYGSGHPKVREIQKRIEITRSLLESQTPQGERPFTQPRPDILQVYLDSLRHKITASEEKLAQLNTLFSEEANAARKLAQEENQSRALREEISRTKQLFETVLVKLQSVELTKDTGTLSAEPVILPAAGRKVAPSFPKNLLLGSLGGLCAGILVVVLIEMSDRSYRTPDEISRHLGAPVIGHIPSLKIAKEKVKHQPTGRSTDLSVFAFHRPNSGTTENYRNVRTALMLGISGDNRIIQVTSPNPSDGKSTLSANLAVTIAQSGKRCLLMDCDLRRPRVHKLFGRENNLGVSSIINHQAELSDAVQVGPIENLDLLSSGPRVKNPAELLLKPEFSQLLELLRDRYDIVIVDTPPILAVSEPSTVATMVDGVVLVVRVGRNSRPLMARVQGSLSMVGANLMGIVVNGVGGSQSKYGGSYSRYSPYYGYGYQYQYGKYGKYSQYHDETPLNEDQQQHV